MTLSDSRLPVGCREHITQVDATMSSTHLKLSELAKLHDPLRIKVTDSGGKPMGGKCVFAMLREMAGYVIGDYQVRKIPAGVFAEALRYLLLHARFALVFRCQSNLIRKLKVGCC
jgi:hypothetical protein